MNKLKFTFKNSKCSEIVFLIAIFTMQMLYDTCITGIPLWFMTPSFQCYDNEDRFYKHPYKCTEKEVCSDELIKFTIDSPKGMSISRDFHFYCEKKYIFFIDSNLQVIWKHYYKHLLCLDKHCHALFEPLFHLIL